MASVLVVWVASLIFLCFALWLACRCFPPWFKEALWKLCKIMVWVFLTIFVSLFLSLLCNKDKQRNEKKSQH